MARASQTFTVAFERRTRSALMGEQDASQPPLPGDWAVYLASRVVDRVPQRSPVPLTPPCVNGRGYGSTVAGGSVMTGARIASG